MTARDLGYGMSTDEPRGGVDWRSSGECVRRGAPFDLFFQEDEDGREPDEPTAEQLSYCDFCVVRETCLEVGLPVPHGVFGGTTAYQRRKLNRPISRKCCQVCSSLEIVRERRAEVCVACGSSWPIGLLDDLLALDELS